MAVQGTPTEGNDVLRSTGNAFTGPTPADGTMTGDSLGGLGGNDVLIGAGGNDTLNGGSGDDTMIGGAGNDSYIVDSLGDTVTEAADEGTDIVSTSVSFALGANIENLSATGSAGVTLTGNGLSNVIRGNSGANAIFGGTDGPTVNSAGQVVAAVAADTLVGGAGSDTYTIRDGNNDLVYEAGDNAVAGTIGGNDTIIVVASQNRVAYDLRTSGTGFSANGTVTGTGASSVETILASEGASTLALDLAGSSVAQLIVGNNGTNRIDDGGAAGADTLIGLGGDDTYVIRNIATVVTEDANGGNDRVIIAGTNADAAVTYTITGAVETITANGAQSDADSGAATGGFAGEAVAAYTGLINITGGATSQVIAGNASANALIGGGGTDTLIGLQGDDTYTVDSFDDVVNETLAGSSGVDRIIALSSYAIGAGAAGAASGIEVLTAGGTNLSTFTGQGDGTTDLNALNTTVTTNFFVGDTAQSQVIFGDAGANIINGRTGTGVGTQAAPGVVDTLVGGAGNDTYRVYDQNDVVVEDTNGGNADFIFSSVSYSLVQNDTNASTAQFSTGGTEPVTRTFGGAGNFINAPMQIEVLSAAQQDAGLNTRSIDLTGNAAGQIIVGDFGSNIITDNGNDSTVAVTGQDQLSGLSGNDIYFVTAQNTTVNESIGGGTLDTVNVASARIASGFFGLIANSEIEFLNATGTAAISLQGNEFNQVITGNSAANTISGGGGQDTFVGGNGGDSYMIDASNASNVTIIERAADTTGVDRVVTSVSFDLGAFNAAYVSSPVVTGSTIGNATSVQGGTEALGGIIAIEQIIVANGIGTEAINLTGNGFAQTLIGNYGNNILNGDNDTGTTNAAGVFTPTGTPDGNGGTNGGADTLVGLFGDDTYRVYSQADVIVEIAGQGTDVAFTSGNYQLRTGNSIEVLSAANQSSTTGLFLTGNELNQTIIGTAGGDTIWGGAGNDTLRGDGGNDTFGFAQSGSGNVDTLADFAPGDLIGLFTGNVDGGFSTQSFSGLTAVRAADATTGVTAGTANFDQNEFVNGTTATEAHAQVLYNQATGQVFYDADGTGAGAAVLFAQLAPNTGLGFNDFVLLATAPTTIAGA